MNAPRRTTLALVAVVAVLLHTQLLGARQAWRTVRRIGKGEAPRAERVRTLRAALPPRGIVGSLTSLPLTADGPHFDALTDPELHLLQYELAPLIVLKGTDHETVVVLLDGVAAARSACDAHRLEVVHDAGGGVLIARRRR